MTTTETRDTTSIYTRSAVHRAVVRAEMRSLDPETRTCEFVVSTESPVDTIYGREVLRMAGAVLDRYRANPVFLDSHNGSTIDNVLGSAEDVCVEGRQMLARLRFAEGGKGERAFELVRQGHVRAVSIGYRIDPASVKRIRQGEADADVQGPAVIVNRWELYEISLVPVPADKDALARAADDPTPTEGTTGECRAPAEVDTTKEARMGADEKAANAAPEPAGAVPVAESRLQEEILRRRVFAICPERLRGVAEQALLEGKTFEECRKVLLEASAAASQPVGTPEPAAATRANPEWPAEITSEVLLRSLKAAL